MGGCLRVVQKANKKKTCLRKRKNMSKHANSPFKKLPHEALQNIKGFYSDKYAPHPTAEMIKNLNFQYIPRILPKVCNPISLCVSSDSPFFKRFWISDFTEPDRYIEESIKDSGFTIGRPVTLYNKFGYKFQEDIQMQADLLGMPLHIFEYHLEFERKRRR